MDLQEMKLQMVVSYTAGLGTELTSSTKPAHATTH